eukprot:6622078-Pyramimonas_sp.AAC.1
MPTLVLLLQPPASPFAAPPLPRRLRRASPCSRRARRQATTTSRTTRIKDSSMRRSWTTDRCFGLMCAN